MRRGEKIMLGKLVLIGLAAGAQPQQQFDLVCSGTLESHSITGDESKPYSYRYRFDLAQNKWCEGACKAPRDILRLAPTQITLADEKTDTVREHAYRSVTIDRETGRHSILSTSNSRFTGPITMKWEGQCEKQPFSGFPEFETKF
jgi:hypothetical protein